MDELTPPVPRRRGLLFYVGTAGLLTTMAVETAAVIGRRIGMPVTGALEIVQAAIVPAACAGMLIATLRHAHATVHMLTERLPARTRQWIGRVGAVLAALLFAALCGGGAWLASEYWNSYEQSEVLHIPFRPLRALVAVTSAALAVAFVYVAWKPGKSA